MLFKNLLFFLVVFTQLNCYSQTKLSRIEKKNIKTGKYKSRKCNCFS